MNSLIIENLEILHKSHKLEKNIVLWGIGRQTSEVIGWFEDKEIKISYIIDNFKYTFLKNYKGIPVIRPGELLSYRTDGYAAVIAVNYAEAIRKQLEAYGITEIYNLFDLSEKNTSQRCNLPYSFINRSKGRKYLCYILAGYESMLWDNTLARIKNFQNDEVDYCIISSGIYDKLLDELADKNEWSYLYTEYNQVCFIQNLVIELHPNAEYIIKMDEDIFIGKNFFEKMIQEFSIIEKEGDYRIGFAVPVIPLNCSGYVSYINAIGKKGDYEQKFGRAYRSRFSAVFDVADTAEFMWDTMDTFDNMAERFLQRKGSVICDCYFNIGCIMFTRDRWLMMGKWPERYGESGMGLDEAYIYKDNVEKDMSIYEIQSVLAGHLAFGHQKQRMKQYYSAHPDKFKIQS